MASTADGRPIAAAADAAYEIAKPMDNTDFELVWRKKMIRALVTYALRELRGDDMRRAARQNSEAIALSSEPRASGEPAATDVVRRSGCST